jgi:3'-phosphoadenosine 5'-phosphosulfate sulfotransferase
MAVKKAAVKNSRQKKVLQMVNEVHAKDRTNVEYQDMKHDEDALRRQLLLIKKDYDRLMTDVATGYGIIRHWVGIQAMTRGELIKSRFIKN